MASIPTPQHNQVEKLQNLRVLHVVVGHGLPHYFRNAVRSVRAIAPTDSLLIIDNASPQQELRTELIRLGENDEKIDVILRSINDVARNAKVGSLYTAYEMAFELATARGFGLVHMLQGDFQMMWWDADLVRKSAEIFGSHPDCVNIITQFMSCDTVLGDDLARSEIDGLVRLKNYGLCDTGIYHLARWNSHAMRFGPTEQYHAKNYLKEGFEVIYHPWPTDAPIPWPAVVRNGVQLGKEVVSRKPFLLKPLGPEQVVQIKTSQKQMWLEDICVPWGWACLSPMWVTSLDTIDYWAQRYWDAKRNGLRHIAPRMESRGVDDDDRRKLLRIPRYRPSLFRLIIVLPLREIFHRLRKGMERGSQKST